MTGHIILHQSKCTTNKTINVVLTAEVKVSPIFKSKSIWITLNEYWYNFTCGLMISPCPPCSATLIICSHTRNTQMMKRGFKYISITSCTLPKLMHVILTAAKSFQFISLMFRDRFMRTGGTGDETGSREHSRSCRPISLQHLHDESVRTTIRSGWYIVWSEKLVENAGINTGAL